MYNEDAHCNETGREKAQRDREREKKTILNSVVLF